jgi:cytochrome bd-type quinol oxidase subunit 2
MVFSIIAIVIMPIRVASITVKDATTGHLMILVLCISETMLLLPFAIIYFYGKLKETWEREAKE